MIYRKRPGDSSLLSNLLRRGVDLATAGSATRADEYRVFANQTGGGAHAQSRMHAPPTPFTGGPPEGFLSTFLRLQLRYVPRALPSVQKRSGSAPGYDNLFDRGEAIQFSGGSSMTSGFDRREPGRLV